MNWIRLLFLLAAIYDGVLGILFFFAPGYPFQRFEIPPPNHLGYVQFPASLLIMFGFMFAQIARDPARNRGLIPYGIWLKLSYCGLAFWYWASTEIPVIWKPFAIADLVMLILFAWAYFALADSQADSTIHTTS